MQTYHVVLSDRSLRILRRGPIQGLRESTRMRMTGPASVLSAEMEAVETGDLTDQVAHVELASLVHATFTPMVGGHWWRLRLHTPDHRYTLRGNGDGREVAAALAPVLGDRLAVRWLHTHPSLRRLRNALGFVSLGLGGLGLIFAGILLVHPPDGLHREDAIVVAAFSFVTLLVGVIPDLIAAGLRRNQPERSKRTNASGSDN